MSHSASPLRVFLKLDEATEQLQAKLLRLVGETIAEYGLIKLVTGSWSAYQAVKTVMPCSTYYLSCNGVLRFASTLSR